MEKQLKIAVVYYSYEGNTRFVAQTIADELGATAIELEPVRPLQSKGFMKYVWGGRQVVWQQKPELKPLTADPADYDLLFVGTPVWAFSMTPAVRAYLHRAKLQGKEIALFCTHEGGRGKTWEHMRRALPGNDILGETEFLNPLANRDTIAEQARAWAHAILAARRPGREV